MHTSGTPRSEDGPCYGRAVRKASRILTRIYDEALAPSGLNLTQFSLAHRLFHESPATIGELARWMDTDKTAMGRNLLPMKRDGLISIAEGADRRSRQVSLTPSGKAHYVQARPLWASAQQGVEKRIGKANATALRSLLHLVATRG